MRASQERLRSKLSATEKERDEARVQADRLLAEKAELENQVLRLTKESSVASGFVRRMKISSAAASDLAGNLLPPEENETREGVAATPEQAVSLEAELRDVDAHLKELAEEKRRAVTERDNQAERLRERDRDLSTCRRELDGLARSLSDAITHQSELKARLTERDEVFDTQAALLEGLEAALDTSQSIQDRLMTELDAGQSVQDQLKANIDSLMDLYKSSERFVANLDRETTVLQHRVGELEEEMAEAAREGAYP